MSFTSGAALSALGCFGVYLLGKAATQHDKHQEKIARKSAALKRMAEDSVKHFINIVNKDSISIESSCDINSYANRHIKELQRNYSECGKKFLRQFFRFEAILIYCCRNKLFFAICSKNKKTSPYVSPIELWDWMDDWLFRECFIKERKQSPLFINECMPEESVKETELAAEELRNLVDSLEVVLFDKKGDGSTKSLLDSCIHVPVLSELKAYLTDDDVVQEIVVIDDAIKINKDYLYDYILQKKVRVEYEEILSSLQKQNKEDKCLLEDLNNDLLDLICDTVLNKDNIIKVLEKAKEVAVVI